MFWACILAASSTPEWSGSLTRPPLQAFLLDVEAQIKGNPAYKGMLQLKATAAGNPGAMTGHSH